MRAKSWPEGATKTRQYDLLRSRVGQKEPPRLGSTICYGQELARKSHQDSAVRFVTAKRGPERATKTRQYDLLRPRVGQKEPPKLGSTICYGQTWARKSPKTRQYDLLRPRVGQKEPPRLGSTVCYGQTWARKSHRDSARPPPPLAHEFSDLAHEFPDLAHEFPDLAHEFPDLAHEFPLAFKF